MNIDTFFNDFLSEIRLTENQKNDLRRGHRTLRERLESDETLSKIIIATFLQGSYRRATAIRPVGDKRADVDVIVVTNLDRFKVSPEEAIKDFIPFLEKYYKGKYRIQGRSIGIELSYVDLDIVVTSAPSEVEQKNIYHSRSVLTELSLDEFTTKYPWKLATGWDDNDLIKGYSTLNESVRKAAEWTTQPLWIPDRDAKCWTETHPLEQIRWTWEKNAKTGGVYVNVVKSLKWFKLGKLVDVKHPKGYPLEHMAGDCCPDDVTSVAEGVVRTMENFVSQYAAFRMSQVVPNFPDRGVPTHNVWKRITKDDFNKFYDHMSNYAKIARKAFDAPKLEDQVKYWKELFGNKFPDPPKDKNSRAGGGFTPREETSVVSGGRFA
jgi:hypothetical protein